MDMRYIYVQVDRRGGEAGAMAGAAATHKTY